ncbi:response regulator transcription factor [Sphingomonas xinjiangensis]|uniref:Two-component system response regulator FixJ n=1 Tax=Sphingomonas xinjiangensis TaxID=643568 RepID=A0A840YBK5_9SPHN|nr:response regulator [Sphingomonas xinjiangensis]MBB5710727.1 two-component system response regulator FixJ [Sphingomonas xinjiangensis]
MTRTVYIVDDDDAVRASLHTLLSIRNDLLIRSYRSGDAFLQEVNDLDPGIVLLDFHMPGATGLDVLTTMNKDPKFVAIVLTGQGNVGLAVQAMKAGALDFVEKPYEADVLMQLLDTAFARLEQGSEAAARVNAAEAKIAKLSPRETDVLKGLIEGRSNKIIAYELDISPRTVEIYRANLMEKLEVRSLSEALRIAFAAGLFPNS